MSFYEAPRFPEKISFGAIVGPEYRTDITQTAAGFEFANQSWADALHSYDVAHAARLEEQYKVLLAFFHNMKGRFHGFRFKDWADYKVETGEGVLVSIDDSPVNSWQMYKRYTSGSITTDRIIQKPVTGKTVITGGGTYTVDTATGIITRSAGPDPTGFTTEFDVPCRFDIDRMRGEIVDGPTDKRIMGWHSIPIVEIKLA